ncbi:hypothetical protein [Desulfosporosinus metallidurans]|uniref:Uncharacterized protein n=1 Tax=Desulfosporosinus metallidurans TaxID=1888891 RepID=A0A1Q8QPV2_9FIRM|nr:hypothetical protein [Desulfosporosinus metallidurans]OLN29379.1 hypothetical protein DSOL_3555 [Desulfosporosinus metallidurans]
MTARAKGFHGQFLGYLMAALFLLAFWHFAAWSLTLATSERPLKRQLCNPECFCYNNTV